MSAAARVVLVHAHPDDETLTTGITMAALREAGHRVHVVTCTLGEEGEVIPPELAHLEGSPELGPWRREELRSAMAVLGVEHEVLGEDGAGGNPAFRDSGMVGSTAAGDPRALVGNVGEAAELLRARIGALAPDVVLTYDEHGGYGHPDHVAVHRLTCRAVAGVAPGQRPDLYAVLTPRTWAREDRAWLGAHPEALDPTWTVPAASDPWFPSVVDDALVPVHVGRPDLVGLQEDALRAHATQVVVGRGSYALSNLLAARLPGREGFALLDPATGLPSAGAPSRPSPAELVAP